MNSLQIAETLQKNKEKFEKTKIFDLYQKSQFNINDTNIVNNPSIMFDILNEIDDNENTYLNQDFLVESAQLLNAKRQDIITFLSYLAENIGMKIQEFTVHQDRSCLILPIEGSEQYYVYSANDDREELIYKLLKTRYSKMILSEERVIEKTDWYKLYRWTLE